MLGYRRLISYEGVHYNRLKVCVCHCYLNHTLRDDVSLVVPCSPQFLPAQVLSILPEAQPFQCPPKFAVKDMPFLIICFMGACRSPQILRRHGNDAWSTEAVRTVTGTAEPWILCSLPIPVGVFLCVKG